MTTGTSTPATPLHKAYSVTNIKSHIPLTLDLNHLNYDTWTDLFETRCIAFDVIDHIDDTYDATLTNPDNKPPTNAEWIKLDSIIRNWIYNTITPDVLANVHERTTTARVSWLAIENLFRTNKEAKALQLDNDLRNITLGNLSIIDYCTKIKTMADLLKNIGTPVPDKNLVAYTLNGLPRKWNGVTQTLRLREKLPTWVETRELLLGMERKLDDKRATDPIPTDTASSPNVLLTGSSSSDNRGGGRRSDRRNGGRRNDRNQPSNTNQQYG